MTSLKLRAVVFPVVLAVFGSASSGHAQTRATLLGNPQVAPLGLETAWSSFVRVDAARGRVASMQVGKGIVVAHTTQGLLQVMNSETGRTMWSAAVGDPSYPTMPPSFNDTFVAMTNGSTLYLFNRENGAVLWQQRLSGSPSAGSAMNADRVWVPLDNGLVEAYLLQRGEGRELLDSIPKRYSGAGGAIVAPWLADKRCSWAVQNGYIYSAEETFKDLKQFRFRTDDDVSTGPIGIPPLVIAASRRGTVYGLDGEMGNEVWRYSVNSSVSHPLVAVDGALYVVDEVGTLVKFDPRVGRPVWQARGVKRFLSVGKDRVYVLDLFNRLTVLNLANGAVLGSTPTSGFDLPCPNMQTDRIYLASTTGVVQCLHDASLAEPLMHTIAAPAVDPAAAQTPAAPGGAAPAGSPFEGTATPAANDPFNNQP